MGCLTNPASAQEALESEIVVTREVEQLVRHWQECGAVILGVSDKPDEAALPATEDSACGYPALHEALTHCVGEDVL